MVRVVLRASLYALCKVQLVSKGLVGGQVLAMALSRPAFSWVAAHPTRGSLERGAVGEAPDYGEAFAERGLGMQVDGAGRPASRPPVPGCARGCRVAAAEIAGSGSAAGWWSG